MKSEIIAREIEELILKSSRPPILPPTSKTAEQSNPSPPMLDPLIVPSTVSLARQGAPTDDWEDEANKRPTIPVEPNIPNPPERKPMGWISMWLPGPETRRLLNHARLVDEVMMNGSQAEIDHAVSGLVASALNWRAEEKRYGVEKKKEPPKSSRKVLRKKK